MPVIEGPLGRRVPPDFNHIVKYPYRLLGVMTPTAVEHTLPLPSRLAEHRRLYDQGEEGQCVGFSCSWMMTLLNKRRYDAGKLYRETQLVDQWPETPPEEGTSVSACMDVLRTTGHWRFFRGIFAKLAGLAEGIAANRWATTVDELRACIATGTPFVGGIPWYSNFDQPVPRPLAYGRTEYWVGEGDLGALRGYHAICHYAASDRRSAFKMINTWGDRYPDVWIPYRVVERLLGENSEYVIVTDR